MRNRPFRLAVSSLTAAAVSGLSIAPAFAQVAQAPVAPSATATVPTGAQPPAPASPTPQTRGAATITRTEYEACQTRDETGFRTAIEGVTTGALRRGLQGLDYRAVVNDEWRRGNFDEVMSRRVDAAIDELRQETSWTDLITSLASKETAQQLAQSAAERVFRSDEIKRAIEGLAVGVGREIGKRIEIATSDTAEPAIQCLQAFLGPRYGSTVAGVVSRDAAREFQMDPSKASASVSTGQVLAESREGIAGAVILIVRRQLANLATRVGQRIVGAVLGRLVAVVAGGIGVVLIAKDIWELRHGVLPIIANEMKSPATRDKVQDELAKAIGEQIGEHVREIGAKTAERVVEIWHDFRRAHAKVLEISEKDEKFRRFVDTVKPENLGRLDEVAALVLASEGEPAILKRLDDGTLLEAVERMPPAAFEIAREQRSLETALKWQALAGPALPKVIEYELYRRNSPDEFTKAGLERLLKLGDRLAVTRLAALKSGVREPLMELDESSLQKLGRSLGEPELASLSGYLTGLEKVARQRLLTAVVESPAKLTAVTPQSVREAIFASRDQTAALGVMLRSDSIFDFLVFREDALLVKDGRISPHILWARYPVALGVLAFLALLLFMLVWRILFGRRPKIIVQK